MRHDFSNHFSDFTVTISRKVIIECLEANQAEHLKIYEEAKRGYLIEAEAALGEKSRAIRDGKLVKLTFSLNIPVCYEDHYTQMIQMFVLSKEDEHELTVAQYRCIVDDAWSWTNDFLITNSVYSVSARDKR